MCRESILTVPYLCLLCMSILSGLQWKEVQTQTSCWEEPGRSVLLTDGERE